MTPALAATNPAAPARQGASPQVTDAAHAGVDAGLRDTLRPLLAIVRQQDSTWRARQASGQPEAVSALYLRSLGALRDCARSAGADLLAEAAASLLNLLEQAASAAPHSPILALIQRGVEDLDKLMEGPLTLPPADPGSAPDPGADPHWTAQPHDLIDPGLLPVFLDEAQELMAGIGDTLLALPPEEAQGGSTLLADLARPLHTLKGSARMVGAMRLSLCLHEMESALQCICGGDVRADLLRLYDRAMEHFSTLEQGAAAAPLPPPARMAQADARPGAPVLRIRTTVLDRLLNQAGEVSIMRAQLDNEVGAVQREVRLLGEQLEAMAAQLRQMKLQVGSAPASLAPLAASMEAALARARQCHKGLHGGVGKIREGLHQQGRDTRELQQELMYARMVKFSSMESRMQHLVRQVAADTGKALMLDLSGCRLQIDRAILERLMGPLEHLLRNAAVHGIEDAAQRRAAGKPVSGQLRIQASHEGNEAVIRVSDDGRGLDLPAIRRKASQRGMPDALAASEARLAELIFEPGFSTSAQVCALAGRGIGMDVVRAEVAALGGRMTVHSRAGQGVQFTLYLPLSLAVQHVCLLRHGQQHYAIPSTLIDSVIQLRSEQARAALAQRALECNGRRLALYPLHGLLGEERDEQAMQHELACASSAFAMLIKNGDELMVILADHVSGNREVVVKPVGPQLATLAGIVGATVLGDGQIVLIINPLLLAGSRPADGSPAAPGVQ